MRRGRHQMPTPGRPSNCLWILALLSVKAIQEKIAELTDRVQAIVDLTDAEKRELKPDEKQEIDGILGVGKKGEAGYKPGTIDQLETDLERAQKLEIRQAQLIQNRGGGGGGGPQRSDGPGSSHDPEDEQPRVARIRIPAQANFRYGKLKAYKGEHANRSAYLAGQYFAASLFRNETAMKWCKDHGIDTNFRAVLSEGANTGGGYLVPVEVEQAIIDLREDYGAFRQEAQIVPMARETKTQPVRTGGPTAYWVGENDEITASDKTWGQVEHVAKKLASLVRYSSELGEDALITVGDDLTREFAFAFAVAEDNAGYNGDGTAAYGGCVGLKSALAAGSIHEAVSGNTAFSTLDLIDFQAAAGMVPEYPGLMPAWHISKPGYWNSMVRLMAAAGGTTWEETANGQRTPIFLGYPVRFVHVMPKALTAIASTIVAYIGDLRMAAQLGNRRGLSIAVSDQRWFEYDQVGIRGIERVSILIHSRGDASNPGPVVALKTPAS